MNKKVLVTGGSKGIGKAIAQKFMSEGAEVIVFDIEKPKYKAEFYKVDISDEEQIAEAFGQIRKLDVLVNNAGIYFQKPVEKTGRGELERLFDVNFKGTFLMCKHALPLIKKRKGNIINIASAIGIAPEPQSPAYCSSKAAVIMLTKCMAQEYATIGVRVNAVAPGPIDTPLLRASFRSKEDADKSARKNPLRRIGSPEEVANVAFFLGSDEASYVTGSIYAVDGGESSSSVYTRGKKARVLGVTIIR